MIQIEESETQVKQDKAWPGPTENEKGKPKVQETIPKSDTNQSNQKQMAKSLEKGTNALPYWP